MKIQRSDGFLRSEGSHHWHGTGDQLGRIKCCYGNRLTVVARSTRFHGLVLPSSCRKDVRETSCSLLPLRLTHHGIAPVRRRRRLTNASLGTFRSLRGSSAVLKGGDMADVDNTRIQLVEKSVSVDKERVVTRRGKVSTSTNSVNEVAHTRRSRASGSKLPACQSVAKSPSSPSPGWRATRP